MELKVFILGLQKHGAYTSKLCNAGYLLAVKITKEKSDFIFLLTWAGYQSVFVGSNGYDGQGS